MNALGFAWLAMAGLIVAATPVAMVAADAGSVGGVGGADATSSQPDQIQFIPPAAERGLENVIPEPVTAVGFALGISLLLMRLRGRIARLANRG